MRGVRKVRKINSEKQSDQRKHKTTDAERALYCTLSVFARVFDLHCVHSEGENQLEASNFSAGAYASVCVSAPV